MLDTIAKYPTFSSHGVINPLGNDPAREMDELAKKGVRAFSHPPEALERTGREVAAPGRLQKISPPAPAITRAWLAYGPTIAGAGPHVYGVSDTPVIIDHLAALVRTA